MHARYQLAKIKRSLRTVSEPLIRERLLIVQSAYEYPTLRESAKHCGTSYVSVKHWRDRYQEYGLKGLAPTPITGRPPKLDPAEAKTIKQAVVRQSGKQSWQVKHVQEYIRHSASITYSLRQTIRIMQSWGLVPLVPRSRYAHSKEADRIAFLKEKRSYLR